jgi:uncharacterized Zn-binding protein involved in type VI secretion
MTLKVDKKGVIRLGDSTTHGCKVVKAGSKIEVNGIPIARVGDSVACPECEGTFSIVEGEPTYTDDGIPVALHGHKTSCGASLITSV